MLVMKEYISNKGLQGIPQENELGGKTALKDIIHGKLPIEILNYPGGKTLQFLTYRH